MQALFFLPRNYLFLFAARIFIEFPKCYHAKLRIPDCLVQAPGFRIKKYENPQAPAFIRVNLKSKI
jgi:hypothetical protein